MLALVRPTKCSNGRRRTSRLCASATTSSGRAGGPLTRTRSGWLRSAFNFHSRIIGRFSRPLRVYVSMGQLGPSSTKTVGQPGPKAWTISKHLSRARHSVQTSDFSGSKRRPAIVQSRRESPETSAGRALRGRLLQVARAPTTPTRGDARAFGGVRRALSAR